MNAPRPYDGNDQAFLAAWAKKCEADGKDPSVVRPTYRQWRKWCQGRGAAKYA